MNLALVFWVAKLAHQIDGLFVSDIVAMGFKAAFFTVTKQHGGPFTAFGDHLILLVLLLAIIPKECHLSWVLKNPLPRLAGASSALPWALTPEKPNSCKFLNYSESPNQKDVDSGKADNHNKFASN
jgi:hypothetical protein